MLLDRGDDFEHYDLNESCGTLFFDIYKMLQSQEDLLINSVVQKQCFFVQGPLVYIIIIYYYYYYYYATCPQALGPNCPVRPKEAAK